MSHASHLFSLSAILKENECLDDFPIIRRFAQYYSNWREAWGTQALTSIICGGVPDGDAWNPITWTLAVEINSAALKILACDQYQYLVAMFQNRRHPLYTRLYWALSAHEAHRLSMAYNDFDKACCKVRALIYDGMLVEKADLDLMSEDGLAIKKKIYLVGKKISLCAFA